MISAYLMMKNIERNKFPEDNLGVSTARFTINKYLGLFPYLLPSVIICFTVYCIHYERTFQEVLSRIPLLIYEIIPLMAGRYKGEYVLGISWYISAMFVVLTILYPLCKKLKQTMSLIICPIISIFIYGMLNNAYGHLAINAGYMEDLPINVGVLRATGASCLGVILYELCKVISAKKITTGGRIVFSAIELMSFAYFFYTMHSHPKSVYDYTLILVIFILLLIGLSEISYSSSLCSHKWTKGLGTASTIIVLNHVALIDFFGREALKTEKLYTYLAVQIAIFIVVWLCSKLIQFIMKNSYKINLFKD